MHDTNVLGEEGKETTKIWSNKQNRRFLDIFPSQVESCNLIPLIFRWKIYIEACNNML